MVIIREVLRLHFELHQSYARIADICGVSKGGVCNILHRFAASDWQWPLPADIDEVTLKQRLYPASERASGSLPDTEKLRKDLARPGVTRQLLWEESLTTCPDGLSRSAFYRHCQVLEKRQPVMTNDFQGGEYFFVDYSGKVLSYQDTSTGATIPVEIFVGSWGASSGTYVEATASQSALDFVYSHVRALNYFGCIPKVITPDNLKAAVTKADRADPTLCQLYRKFAEYYDLVILPARVRKPRDKATAESAVCMAQRRILAPLRDQTFFSLAEINAAILPHLEALNDRPMRAYNGQSRRDRFQQYDLPAARPLPVEPFSVNDAKYQLRVPRTYQITYAGHRYSVPCTLIDHHVDLFQVGDVVEIYHHGDHVVRHALQPPDGKQSVIDAHRPESHRRMKERSKDYYLHVAEAIGEFTRVLVEGIYTRSKHDEHAHRTSQGVISLCKQYDSSRVEAAAERALHYRRPTLRDVKQILAQGLDQQPLPGGGQRELPLVTHDNVRGPGYYEGE